MFRPQIVSGSPTITGGGIYVKGTADEITLSKTLTGAQVYAIKQGSTTTTITITPPTSLTAGTTVVSNSSGTTTFQGVPMDKTNPVAAEQKPGVALYVDGGNSKLHGPAVAGGAVAAQLLRKTRI